MRDKLNVFNKWKTLLLAAIAMVLSVIVFAGVFNKIHMDTLSKKDADAKKIKYTIFIEVEDKRLYLLQGGECVKSYPVSTGKPGSPSPIGFWKIINKGDWGEGFGGSWMGLNVPWGKFGIHGTLNPGSIGWGASHGCIRMYSRDAAELYRTVPVGTPVVIVNGSFGPFGRGFRVIDVGDRGADVAAVQKRLKELGFYHGSVDGIYQDGTKRALHQFQKACGLPVKNQITRKDMHSMGFWEFE